MDLLRDDQRSVSKVWVSPPVSRSGGANPATKPPQIMEMMKLRSKE